MNLYKKMFEARMIFKTFCEAWLIFNFTLYLINSFKIINIKKVGQFYPMSTRLGLSALSIHQHLKNGTWRSWHSSLDFDSNLDSE
jgi:hypothetical protein